MRRAALLILLACAVAAGASAQDKPLSLDALYHPEARVDFTGTAPRSLTWLDERRLHWPRTDPRTRRTEHFVIDADTGDLLAVDDITIGGVGQRSISLERRSAESYAEDVEAAECLERAVDPPVDRGGVGDVDLGRREPFSRR